MTGNRKYRSAAAGILLVLLSSMGMGNTGGPDKEIAATVNEAVITRAELEREMLSVMELLRLKGARMALNQAQLAQLQTRVLERLIERELLFQESERSGLRVAQAEVDSQLESLKNEFSDPARYQEALASLHINEAELREEIKREVAIQKLIDQTIVSRTRVSDAEARSFYQEHPGYFHQPEQVRIRQIFIKRPAPALDPVAANGRKQMEQILLRLQEGEPFAALAAQYSEGRAQNEGGDLGYMKRGEMAKPIENWAFALKPGDVSGIIETRDGYHLIQVMDTRPAVQIDFADVRNALKNYLKKEKVETSLEQLLARLKKAADIQRLVMP